jgi:predicted Rossmann-fold nucleotide-binding protein
MPVSVRLLLLLGASLLAGCGTVSSMMEPIAFDARCNAGPFVPRANYVGPYLGVENVLTPADFARDMYCADVVKTRLFPRGYVTVFGSSRIAETNPLCDGSECDAEVTRSNDATYAMVKRFAILWTARHGHTIPIMTGAGPGLMEAANRGASEAGGPSVGYTTYYDRAARPTPERPYGGDPTRQLNPYVGNGLIFTSVVAREAAMIKHSAAMVIAPGGTGTEWEIYQIIETVKSRQVLPVPVYFLGDASQWASLQARLEDMAKRRVIRRQELAFLRFAGSAEELASALRADLKLD